MKQLLSSDLDWIYSEANSELSALSGRKIFITGGTGFFGKWLLYALEFANQKLPRPIEVAVLSRNPESFLGEHPLFKSNKHIYFVKGEITQFEFPKGSFDFIIHAATEASDKLNRESPQLMFDTIVNGTKRVLDFAKVCGAKRILLTSSGAVYGAQPTDLAQISEEYFGGPNCLDARSAYGEGKRVSELIASIYAKQTGAEILVARCFAFLGPFLPLDTHFAVGNFISDCINGRDIIIKGDGTSLRSYLYSADLVHWLLKILVQGKSLRAYNVGSEKSFSIKEIAENVLAVWNESLELQSCNHALKISILGSSTGRPPERYVPSTFRTKSELNLTEKTLFREAILKTFLFHLHKGNQ